MAIQFLVPGKGYLNSANGDQYLVPYFGYVNDNNSAPSLVAGVASTVSAGNTIATVTVTSASGGTPPYTYQWYRSTTSGFTPGSGNILSGKTAQTLNDTGLTNGITYYYKNVVTDSSGVPVTATSNQISAYPFMMAAGRQFLVSGKGYLNETVDIDYLIPYFGFQNETSGVLLAGFAATTLTGNTTATVTVTDGIGGVQPYTYQWYRSTTVGFTPGGGNIVSGATSQTLNDTGLTNAVSYYYKNVVTDSASNTAISNQVLASPQAPISAIFITGFFG